MCEVVEVQLSQSSKSVEWSQTPTELTQGRGGTEELENSYQRIPNKKPRIPQREREVFPSLLAP